MNISAQESLRGNYLLPFYNRFPVRFVRGFSARLYDEEGNEYIDFSAGIATNSLGYSHPLLLSALSSQLSRLTHISNLYEIPEQELLARSLSQFLGFPSFFFCNSGAEANESALKIVRLYQQKTGRKKIVVMEGGFHGRTMGALSLTAQEEFQRPFRPLLPHIVSIPFGDQEMFQKTVDEDTAGVFLEPIQGEGGGTFPPPGYLSFVREWTKRVGALLVLDEVQTGMGRTGYPLFSLKEGCRGDIVTLAKGLGGGIPIGAMGVTEELIELVKPGLHASTFGGNPLSCTAGLVVVKVLSQDGFLEEVRKKGEKILLQWKEWEEEQWITSPRGEGLFLAFTLPGVDVKAFATACIQEGKVLVVPAKKNTIRITPPLTILPEEIEEGLLRLKKVLTKWKR